MLLGTIYWEQFMVAQQQRKPWLADCHVRYWDNFENEEQEFFEHQQHQDVEDEVEIEEILDEEVIDNEENENNVEEEQQHLINYETNLPVEARAQARCRKRCN
jgi:hypothetical protein